ncbi:gonadotropin-releasing hormone II receptor-like [Aricia agestis]|uniref:gonadotropin-releasing hormone II receptor-like n=1 Tax=Aricia agestis TaxID=91739 RepID=UPI001C20A30B|nr:gonadotropin-releasing hormone II receptor-like [Aricia agestis]
MNMNISDVDPGNSRDTSRDSPEGFVVGIYASLFVVGATGNVAVFVSLIRSRRRKSRVNLLMTHLAIADMIVTFIVIPLEIGWQSTNAWLAGNLACKVFLVLRAFGLYLSSNVLVCISLDRFFAVLYPLRLAVVRKRSKIMLTCAWVVALLCSLPQSLVFRVMHHPTDPDFQQCVSFGAFSNQHQELAYNVTCLLAMYFLPLIIITVCYIRIFYEIRSNSTDVGKSTPAKRGRIQLRRSDQRPLVRARRKTLRMTVTIVTVFACCWLPYATMTLWYMLDRQSAVHVPARVQDLFFIMAVSNSCMDPLVYGSYTLDKNLVYKTLRKIFCGHKLTDEKTANLEVFAMNRTKNITSKSVQCSRRSTMRFEETMLVAPSANSAPVSCWRDDKDLPEKNEIFTLQY